MSQNYFCPVCGDDKDVRRDKELDRYDEEEDYYLNGCYCSHCSIDFMVKYELCEICGKPVCFQREQEWMPREYDVCSVCDRHVCPDCSKYNDDEEGPFCKKCFEEMNNGKTV